MRRMVDFYDYSISETHNWILQDAHTDVYLAAMLSVATVLPILFCNLYLTPTTIDLLFNPDFGIHVML